MAVGEAQEACEQALLHAEEAAQLLVEADSTVAELTADQAAGSSVAAAEPVYSTVRLAMGHAVATLSSVKSAAFSKLRCEGCMSAACRKDDSATSAGGGGGDGWGAAEQQRLATLRSSFRALMRATSEVAASCCNTAEMLSKLASAAPGGGDPGLPAGLPQDWREHLAALTGAHALLQQIRLDQSWCESRVGREIASSATAVRSQLQAAPAVDPKRLSLLDQRVAWAADVERHAETGWDDAVQSETLYRLSQVMAARAQTEAARGLPCPSCTVQLTLE
ncbi:hypothetical protein HYH02_010687 [Chlamydomonas schloesseri]|uniref:Uncharacterized protein n=1 Tax=Chlamydomonas schloesseri TaxID=2026947 RepID=A0A835TIB8_9CHLO|nr:hypothetical protein HYH02_010687 [Chlamydomonas schloesseri]|eukprot:KAG2438891.1 hypothetical protein HYH02_010687 [Chlamydomonas schloesseri]